MEAKGDCPWMLWKRDEDTLLGLTFAKSGGSALEVLCIGAHCDDIEIGCGGTVLSLQRRYPECRVHLLVLTSSPARRAEAAGSAKPLVKVSARGEVRIGELPDGLLPAHFEAVKAEFERMKKSDRPRPCVDAPRARPASRSQPHQSRHMANVPRSHDLGIRNSKVRWRPGYTEYVRTAFFCAGGTENCPRDARVSFAAQQALVQGGKPRGNDATSGARKSSPERIRGSFPLPQAGE